MTACPGRCKVSTEYTFSPCISRQDGANMLLSKSTPHVTSQPPNYPVVQSHCLSFSSPSLLRRPTTAKMPQINEEAIQQALQDVTAGRYSSICSAARMLSTSASLRIVCKQFHAFGRASITTYYQLIKRTF
jgi:hypothetical protein